MSTIRITKIFKFESAHALEGYDGKCKHIHGHSYILHVTIKGTAFSEEESVPKGGMLIDFTDLKRVVEEAVINKYDHSLVIKEGAPLSQELAQSYGNVIIVPFRPTCENLVANFAHEIGQALANSGISIHGDLYSLRLYETATSYAEWFCEDNTDNHPGNR